MTAQIGVLNKRAVALASDSAVTIEDDDSDFSCKIYNSADKLFLLSEKHSVGIMIFNSGYFVGIPIENLIDTYRKKLGVREFNTLKEYYDDFQEFIRSGYELPSLEEQQALMERNICAWLSSFFEDARRYYFIEKKTAPDRRADVFIRDFICAAKEQFSEFPFSALTTYKQQQAYLKKYSKTIESFAMRLSDGFLLDEELIQVLCDIVMGKVFRQYKSDDMSGIVIAGFGKNELFPSLYGFAIEGIGDDKISVVEKKPIIISDKQEGAIASFAQDEMVHLFIEGIDPDLQSYALDAVAQSVERRFSELANRFTKKNKKGESNFIKEEIIKEVVNEYFQLMHKYKQDRHVDPILKMVGSLPEKELAIMAESLVELTAFKRRVTMEPGTVGGPIDVAIITKAGFRWVGGKYCCPSGPILKT